MPFWAKHKWNAIPNPTRSAGNVLGAILGKIQRKSYTNAGAKHRKSFEGPFWHNAKEILYKIQREAPENPLRTLVGQNAKEILYKSGAKRLAIVIFPHSPESRDPPPSPQPAGEEGGGAF